MEDLFKNMLGDDESLFLDSVPLDPDFQPPIVKYRENEQQYVAECVKPLFSKRGGKNLVVMGTPGIGKTVAVRHILNELGKETSEIKRIYVNCWKKDTPYKIALDICEQLGFKFVANRDTSELFGEIAKILNRGQSVIVFDECDKVSDEQVFYTVMEDVFNKCLIFITNERGWLSKLDNRVRSRLMTEILEFKQYGFDETKGILKERVDYALVPDVFDECAFNVVVEKTFEFGDVRVGLFLLKNSVEYAEGKASRKIEMNHVINAVEKLEEFHRKSREDLDEEGRFMLKVIKINSGISTKSIYDKYKAGGGSLAYTTFQRKMKGLEKSKFITIKDVNTGSGRTNKVIYGSLNEDLNCYF